MCLHTKKDLLDFYVIVINIFIPFFSGMIAGGHLYGLLDWGFLGVIFARARKVYGR